MTIILGIESTAHTFGIGIVRDGKILANVKDTYTTEKGGIIPVEAAKHHDEVKNKLYEKALKESGISEEEINGIAFSQGPGLAPCLQRGRDFSVELSKKLNVPVVPVNHCVAHLEIGKSLKKPAKDPVMLYVSGANTQVIAFEGNKYRVFGETLDVGVGNFIDNFAREAGIGFPGGPKIQEFASKGKKFIELPYVVKGMDISLSGILTNLKQKLKKVKLQSATSPTATLRLHSQNVRNINDSKLTFSDFSFNKKLNQEIPTAKNSFNNKEIVDYTLEDLAFSLQENVFAMLVEVAERALAHTGKKELLLGGGVACNSRLQEMCKKMCDERIEKTEFFVPERSLLVDNGAMIAYLGEILFNSGIKVEKDKLKELDFKPYQRTDDVEVTWK